MRLTAALLHGERFSDGLFSGALRDGTVATIVERFRSWRDAQEQEERAGTT